VIEVVNLCPENLPITLKMLEWFDTSQSMTPQLQMVLLNELTEHTSMVLMP
jgi:hypothetical protein